uniref:Uncharacterized protein n=1 Tax=Anguilla anguilla TaxID=7936 RepID=A0A0E9PM71_ANGAN
MSLQFTGVSLHIGFSTEMNRILVDVDEKQVCVAGEDRVQGMSEFACDTKELSNTECENV